MITANKALQIADSLWDKENSIDIDYFIECSIMLAAKGGICNKWIFLTEYSEEEISKSVNLLIQNGFVVKRKNDDCFNSIWVSWNENRSY